MDAFDPATVFSSIDHHGRYAYGNQPSILQWNLARFAETLVPVMATPDRDAAVALATVELEAFAPLFLSEWESVMRAKLGLRESRDGDGQLVGDLLDLMEAGQVDFTQSFRALSDALRGDRAAVQARFPDADAFEDWFVRWAARMDAETGADDRDRRQTAADRMDEVNPVYIPRNHLVEEALDAAEEALDLGPARRLLDVLAEPFAVREGLTRYSEPAPDDFGPYVTYCGT